MAGFGGGTLGLIGRGVAVSDGAADGEEPDGGVGAGQGVTLVGSNGTLVSLPWPAHNQPVESIGNQSVNYTAGGQVVVYLMGRARFRITRTFEGLTEQRVKSLSRFWVQNGRAAGAISYQYTDRATGDTKSVPCRIIEDPRETKTMRDIWDVTLVFEQSTHPDVRSDP